MEDLVVTLYLNGPAGALRPRGIAPSGCAAPGWIRRGEQRQRDAGQAYKQTD